MLSWCMQNYSLQCMGAARWRIRAILMHMGPTIYSDEPAAFRLVCSHKEMKIMKITFLGLFIFKDFVKIRNFVKLILQK